MAATAHAIEAQSLFQVEWDFGRRPVYSHLIVGRDTVSVPAFKSAVGKLVEKLAQFFEAQVMLGLKVADEEWKDALINMGDNLRMPQKGFSLASRSNNKRL